MGKFLQMIQEGAMQEEIAAYLDSLDHEARLKEVESISGKVQPKLYALAKNDVTVSDLIPPDGTPLQQVIFYGRNSLPFQNIFQKRMCRSRDGSVLWGYNYQSLRWLTGPGYFVVANDSDRSGEVMIDYTKTPGSPPEDWPSYKPNGKGISRLVYAGMKDYLRHVSRNVFIGEATKKGKKMGQYFLLCRQ